MCDDTGYCCVPKRIKLDEAYVDALNDCDYCDNKISGSDQFDNVIKNKDEEEEGDDDDGVLSLGTSLHHQDTSSEWSSLDNNLEQDSSSTLSGSFCEDSNESSGGFNIVDDITASIHTSANTTKESQKARVQQTKVKSILSRRCFSNRKQYKKKRKKIVSIIPKNHIRFCDAQVYYFNRQQSFCSVPSIGGSALGMEMQHFFEHRIDLGSLDDDDDDEEDVQLMDRCAKTSTSSVLMHNTIDDVEEKVFEINNINNSNSNKSIGHTSDSAIIKADLNHASYLLDTVGSEKYSILQPIIAKHRRTLLKNSDGLCRGGTSKDSYQDSEICDLIRSSRERCGCRCSGGRCEPPDCICAANGIQCQVDRGGFPCACGTNSSSSGNSNNSGTGIGFSGVSACGNPAGRLEFNVVRVRTHFIHTMMRLQMLQDQEQDDYDNCSTSSSNGAVGIGGTITKETHDSECDDDDDDDGDNNNSTDVSDAFAINDSTRNVQGSELSLVKIRQKHQKQISHHSQWNSTKQGACRDCQNDKYLQVLMSEWAIQLHHRLQQPPTPYAAFTISPVYSASVNNDNNNANNNTALIPPSTHNLSVNPHRYYSDPVSVVGDLTSGSDNWNCYTPAVTAPDLLSITSPLSMTLTDGGYWCKQLFDTHQYLVPHSLFVPAALPSAHHTTQPSTTPQYSHSSLLNPATNHLFPYSQHTANSRNSSNGSSPNNSINNHHPQHSNSNIQFYPINNSTSVYFPSLTSNSISLTCSTESTSSSTLSCNSLDCRDLSDTKESEDNKNSCISTNSQHHCVSKDDNDDDVDNNDDYDNDDDDDDNDNSNIPNEDIESQQVQQSAIGGIDHCGLLYLELSNKVPVTSSSAEKATTTENVGVTKITAVTTENTKAVFNASSLSDMPDDSMVSSSSLSNSLDNHQGDGSSVSLTLDDDVKEGESQVCQSSSISNISAREYSRRNNNNSYVDDDDDDDCNNSNNKQHNHNHHHHQLQQQQQQQQHHISHDSNGRLFTILQPVSHSGIISFYKTHNSDSNHHSDFSSSHSHCHRDNSSNSINDNNDMMHLMTVNSVTLATATASVEDDDNGGDDGDYNNVHKHHQFSNSHSVTIINCANNPNSSSICSNDNRLMSRAVTNNSNSVDNNSHYFENDNIDTSNDCGIDNNECNQQKIIAH